MGSAEWRLLECRNKHRHVNWEHYRERVVRKTEKEGGITQKAQEGEELDGKWGGKSLMRTKHSVGYVLDKS